MKARTILIAAGLAFLLGTGTCYFGVRHEVAQIPPQQRARMSDTDWIGDKWVVRGLIINAAGVLLLVAAGVRSRCNS